MSESESEKEQFEDAASLFMSESEKEQFEDAVSRVGEGDSDDDGSGRRDDQRKKTKKKGTWCGGNLGKAKMVALCRFRKVEKQLRRRNKRADNPSSSSSAGCLGKRIGGGAGGRVGGGGGGYCCCFRQTPTLDSPVESQTSDPNSPEFTYELLRALIEKNDFYSKECNPHLDIDNAGER